MVRWTCAMMLAALSVGCAARPTQLVVVVDTDLLPSRCAAVRITLSPADDPAGVPTQDRTFQVVGARGPTVFPLPLSFGVLPPGGDPARRVQVAVAAVDDTGHETVRRNVRTGFVRGQTLRLPVFLANACVGVSCSAPDTTCDRGACVALFVAPETLAPAEPGTELEDAGPPSDAPPPDAAPIVEVDAGLPCMEVAASLRIPRTGVTAMSLAALDGRPQPFLVSHVSGRTRVGSGFSLDLSTVVTSLAADLQADTDAIDLALPPGGLHDGVGLASRPDGVSMVDVTSSGSALDDGLVLYTGTDFVVPPRAVALDGSDVWLGWQDTSVFRLARIITPDVPARLVTSTSAAGAVGSDHQLAPTGDGPMVVYTDPARACHVQRLDHAGVLADSLTLTTTADCTHPSAAELSGGRIVVAYVLGGASSRLDFQIFDASLDPAGPTGSIDQDGAAGSTRPYSVALLPGTDRSFIAVWVSAAPAIHLARIDAGGTMGRVRALAMLGSSVDELATLRAARVGDRVAIAWVSAAGVNVAVACDDGT